MSGDKICGPAVCIRGATPPNFTERCRVYSQDDFSTFATDVGSPTSGAHSSHARISGDAFCIQHISSLANCLTKLKMVTRKSHGKRIDWKEANRPQDTCAVHNVHHQVSLSSHRAGHYHKYVHLSARSHSYTKKICSELQCAIEEVLGKLLKCNLLLWWVKLCLKKRKSSEWQDKQVEKEYAKGWNTFQQHFAMKVRGWSTFWQSSRADCMQISPLEMGSERVKDYSLDRFDPVNLCLGQGRSPLCERLLIGMHILVVSSC